MTTTTVAATYRARIADRGATTVSGNVALTLAVSDLAGIPTPSGPSVDVLKGATTSHPFDLECIVDSVLFVDSNRLAAIGRLVEVQRSTDDGGSWSTLATGRISGASEIDTRGKITLSVSDERWVERDTEIFRSTDTVQLFPPGLASAWLNLPAAGTETFDVVDVDGNAVKIAAARMATPSKTLRVPRSLRNVLTEDMAALQDIDNSNTSTGNFTALRFRYNSLDNGVINFSTRLGGLVTKNTILGALRPAGTGILNTAWVQLGSGHGLSAGNQITGRFYFVSEIPTSESIPKHIGGTSGIHPMTLLKEILDGDHGGQAVLYDSTAMSTLEALDFPKVWARITGPVDRAKWLQPNIYQPYAVAPMVGTDLAYRPGHIGMPQDITIGNLTTLDSSNSTIPTWDHGSRELVNVIEFSSQAVEKLSETSERGDDWPVDELEGLRQRVRDITHDNTATLGRVVRTYATDLIFSTENDGFSVTNDVSRTLADALFNVFGDGAEVGEVTVDDGESVQVGDLVLLDHDSLKGFNPATGGRTGDRLVLLIGFSERTPSATRFRYLGLGPDSAPLSSPTVSIIQNTSDADMVDVTISSLPAGATAVVQVDTGTVTPTDYRYVRSGIGNETISFRVGAGSGTAYVRAKSVAPHRVESAWATDTVALSTRPTITSADVSRLFTTAEVEWTVPSETLGFRTDYDIHNRGADPTWGNNVTDYDAADGGFTITGFDSDRQMVSVRLTPYTGWTGSAVSGTAGDVLELQAVLRKIGGRIFLPRYNVPTAEVTFDENGEAVVSAQADEEAENIYFTVGDGSSPSDPTAGANDASISGRFGTVSTGVKITTGNDAFVKAVAEDSDGNLGPVTEFKQARRLGPFHHDTTTRSHTGDTNETTLETITVPANTLGSDGSLRIELRYEYTGTAGNKTLRVKLNTDTIFGLISSSATDQYSQVLLFNDGATNDQQAVGFTASSSGSVSLVNNETLAEDSTADMDIVITAELGNSGDQIDLVMTHVTFEGTN